MARLPRLAGLRLVTRRAATAAVLAGGAGAAASTTEPATLPRLESLRLLQVQSTFRHGARTPMEDMGEMPVQWTAAEQRVYARPSERADRYCALSLLHKGATRPVDAIEFFGLGALGRGGKVRSGSTLYGGGSPGILTNVGLGQANSLGASLRSRYVDPEARECAQVDNRRYLLPSGWSEAQRLVETRSTLVERTVFTASGVLAGLFPAEAAAGFMRAEVRLNVPRGGGNDAWGGPDSNDEFMVLNVQRCPRLKALFRQGQRLSTLHLDERQRAVLAAVENWHAADSWLVGPSEWKLIAYAAYHPYLAAQGLRQPRGDPAAYHPATSPALSRVHDRAGTAMQWRAAAQRAKRCRPTWRPWRGGCTTRPRCRCTTSSRAALPSCRPRSARRRASLRCACTPPPQPQPAPAAAAAAGVSPLGLCHHGGCDEKIYRKDRCC